MLNAAEQVRRLGAARVAVLGDVMVDRFIWGRVARISPEAPVPVVEVDRSRDADGYRLGGAANVAHNLVTLGGRASLYGVVGEDDAGRELWRLLASRGIDGRGILTIPGRPTTLKTRVIAHAQQVVRFDVEERSPLPDAVIGSIYDRLLEDAASYDAVIISDYAKGVVQPARLPALIAALRERGKIVAIDPRVCNVQAYVGATVVTPNRLEACAAAGLPVDAPEAPRRAGAWWLSKLECDAVLVTLGEDGMMLIRPGGLEVAVPARAVEVFDVTGAGDTVVAVLTLALAARFGWMEAVTLANAAAGIVVGKVGTAAVAAGELERVLDR